MITEITRRRALLLGASGTAALAGCPSDNDSTETTTTPTEKTPEESQPQTSNALIIQSDEQYTIQQESSESYPAVKIHDNGTLRLESNAALRLTISE